MSVPGHFSSHTGPSGLGHVCTMRAGGVVVEAHAPTREEAEADAALALTQELARQEWATRYPRAVHQPLSTRRPS